jgi:hypothetical protein
VPRQQGGFSIQSWGFSAFGDTQATSIHHRLRRNETGIADWSNRLCVTAAIKRGG